MLDLFKKKKKIESSSLIPEPPTPSDDLSSNPFPSMPDDHPLDSPLEAPPELPSTDFADDHKQDDIANAIDKVSALEEQTSEESLSSVNEQPSEVVDASVESEELHGPMDIEKLPFDPSSIPDTPQEEPLLEPVEPVLTDANNSQIENFPENGSINELTGGDDIEEELPSFGQDIGVRQDLPQDHVTKATGFGIYIDIRDYERIFSEIKYIDSFSKRCFRTVLNLRDISGNQNKLLEKFQNDLSYINERLTFMDQAFFEQNG